MAVTTTATFDRFNLIGGGVGPSDAGGRYYESVVSDEDGLDTLNDEVKQIPIAANMRLVDGGMELGDHDAGASVTHSLIYNDGSSDHEIIKDATTGQGGGTVRFGGGTAPDRVPAATSSAEGYISVKTTAAPATAQTASRYVRVWVYVQPDP
jgi:hypothetical protein